jgi:predicted outer membrane repeat protein
VILGEERFFFGNSGGWVENCSFSDWDGGADALGGAIRFSSSGNTVTNCVFERCFAGYGGAIFSDNLVLGNCEFTECRAGQKGGAVFIGGGDLFLTDCTFTGNLADESGGALYVEGDIRGGFITAEGNQCTLDGGVAYGQDEISITNSVFKDNYSIAGDGGTLYNKGLLFGESALRDCIFENSMSSGDGGAICFKNGGTRLTVDRTRFLKCGTAGEGQAIFFRGGSSGYQLSVINSLFLDCAVANSYTIYTDWIEQLFHVTFCNFGPGGWLHIEEGSSSLSPLKNTVFYSRDYVHDWTPPLSVGPALERSIGLVYGYETIPGFYFAGHCLSDDPLLQEDGSPGATSPCLNAVKDGSGASVDIDGVARPRQDGYDIGCFERDYIPQIQLKITAQPQSVTTNAGALVQFSVTANGTGTLSYQWRKNGVNIEGANLASYTISNVQPVDQGTYDVVASNSAESIQSNPATLQIILNERVVFETPRWSQTTGFSTSMRGQVQTAYRVQWSTNLVTWFDLTNFTAATVLTQIIDRDSKIYRMRFYRGLVFSITNVPSGMVLIPAGSFTMGDNFNEGYSWELPTHTMYVSAFYLDRYEVTKDLWDDVYTWAMAHGYSFDNAGSGKGVNHPVQTVNWYDVVKWYNARSQKEGRVPAYYTDAAQTTVYRTGQVSVQNGWVKWNAGYRLPTEAEWEQAGAVRDEQAGPAERQRSGGLPKEVRLAKKKARAAVANLTENSAAG